MELSAYSEIKYCNIICAASHHWSDTRHIKLKQDRSSIVRLPIACPHGIMTRGLSSSKPRISGWSIESVILNPCEGFGLRGRSQISASVGQTPPAKPTLRLIVLLFINWKPDRRLFPLLLSSSKVNPKYFNKKTFQKFSRMGNYKWYHTQKCVGPIYDKRVFAKTLRGQIKNASCNNRCQCYFECISLNRYKSIVVIVGLYICFSDDKV